MSNSYKHIIHTVPAISEEASGPSYSVVRLCDSLVSKNNTITLAVLESGVVSPLIQYLKQFPISFWPARLGISRPFKKWIIEQSRDAKVDIIHNHGLWMMPNIYPSYAAKNYGVPLMLAPRGALSVHAMASGSKVKKLFWPLLQRPALDAVTCFHATSFSEYEDIRRLGFNQPVAVLPNGIDIPEIQACENKQYRTLLFLGRIHPIKGLDLLLRAWKNVHLRFSEWELRVIGPDNRGHLREMRSLASDLGLKRIRFSGPVYGSKKSKVFADADLFVLPSYSENFGVAVAESLAASTPAIVTKGAPWEGLVTHNAGWWVDTNVESLERALSEALDKTAYELSVMGSNGRTWMSNEYNWNIIGDKMIRTYQWMIHDVDKPEWVIDD